RLAQPTPNSNSAGLNPQCTARAGSRTFAAPLGRRRGLGTIAGIEIRVELFLSPLEHRQSYSAIGRSQGGRGTLFVCAEHSPGAPESTTRHPTETRAERRRAGPSTAATNSRTTDTADYPEWLPASPSTASPTARSTDPA